MVQIRSKEIIEALCQRCNATVLRGWDYAIIEVKYKNGLKIRRYYCKKCADEYECKSDYDYTNNV